MTELKKITDADYNGIGLDGLPDVPGLSTEEMQEKLEEAAKLVVAGKVNEVIDYILANLVTNEQLEKLVISAGAVTSVFGRAGDITAKTGDYTAAMVGAAPADFVNTCKSKAVNSVLEASGWRGIVPPFTQEINVTDLPANANGFIGLVQESSEKQRELARNASLSVTAQAPGKLTVSADGDKPTEDIPVTVTILY